MGSAINNGSDVPPSSSTIKSVAPEMSLFGTVLFPSLVLHSTLSNNVCKIIKLLSWVRDFSHTIDEYGVITVYLKVNLASFSTFISKDNRTLPNFSHASLTDLLRKTIVDLELPWLEFVTLERFGGTTVEVKFFAR
jgi:hypothetical protein